MAGALTPSMRILMTGGAGFIGSVAVRALRAAGDEIVVLDTLEDIAATAWIHAVGAVARV